jgi:hypothetical protein
VGVGESASSGEGVGDSAGEGEGEGVGVVLRFPFFRLEEGVALGEGDAVLSLCL